MTSAGVVARAELFPHHFRTSDGGEGRRWYYRWFAGVDGATLTYDQEAPEALAEVVATPVGDVGVGELDEDGEDEASLFRGATEGFIRRPGGAWESVGAIASGPAVEHVTALSVTSTGVVVGVGYALTYDEAAGQTLQPLVRSTADGVTWAAETIGGTIPAEAFLQSACARPDGSVVAWGTQSDDGVTSRAFGVQRATDGTWMILPTVGLEADAVSCAVTATGRTVLRLAGPTPALAYSDDGINFVPADTSQIGFDDYNIAEIVPADSTLVGVGRAQGPGDEVALVVTSTDDGATWEVADVRGMGGLGEQRATGAVVTDDGDLVIVGVDNGAPAGWRFDGSDL